MIGVFCQRQNHHIKKIKSIIVTTVQTINSRCNQKRLILPNGATNSYFFRKFYGKAERGELDFITDKVNANFQEELIRDQQIDFKSKAKSFYRTYNYP